MNNQGQSVITIFFWVAVFLIGFGMFFSKVINETSAQAISSGNVTGFEAFVFANLTVFIIIDLLIFILAYMYIGGGG